MSESDKNEARDEADPVNAIIKQTKDLHLEESFERHKQIVEQAKEEYTQAYRQLVENLSVDHLKPFGDILREHENCTLKNPDGLVKTLKDYVYGRLEAAEILNDPDVANSLISLEILKEMCKEFDGANWEDKLKSADQCTLPFRIQFKEKRLRYLDNQFKLQSSQLEEILSVNAKSRTQIQEVTKERIHLKEKINKFLEHFKEAKNEMLQMQQEVLDTYDNDVN